MILVALGNVAVAIAEVVSSTQKQAEAAGPLGRVTIEEDGKKSYGVLTKRPHPLGESVTTFTDQGTVEAGYPLTDFLRDIRTAYVSQHSDAPPSWVYCSEAALAPIVAMELRGESEDEIPVVDEIPADAGPGNAGTIS